MLEEALQAIAAAGGTAIVGAMATDGWGAMRERIEQLFRHGPQEHTTVHEELAQGARAVEAAPDADRERVRAEAALLWERRLVDLLLQHPDLAEEITALASAPHEHAAPSTSVQHNIAAAGGTLYAVQHGDQHITHT